MAHKVSNIGSTPAATGAPGSASITPSTSSGAAGSTSSPTGTVPAGSGGSPAVGMSTGVVNPGLSPAGVTSPKKHGLDAKVQDRLHGLRNFLTPNVGLVINGQTFTVASLIQSLQTMDDLYTALAAAEEQSKTAIVQARQAVNAELPAIQSLIIGLDNTLRGYFGKGNPLLENFGIATGARKKKLTGIQQAEKTASAQLTRQARHTMGKKQKLLVTGGKATVSVTGPDGSAVAGGSPAATPAAGGGNTGSNGGSAK